MPVQGHSKDPLRGEADYSDPGYSSFNVKGVGSCTWLVSANGPFQQLFSSKHQLYPTLYLVDVCRVHRCCYHMHTYKMWTNDFSVYKVKTKHQKENSYSWTKKM